MNSIEYSAEQTRVKDIADALEVKIRQISPDLRIDNVGDNVFINAANFVLSVLVISEDFFDISGSATLGEHEIPVEREGLTLEQVLRVVKYYASGGEPLDEEKTERDQTGRKDARDYPFGEDPLGALARMEKPNKNSEGERKSPFDQNFEGGSRAKLGESATQATGESSLFNHLKGLLPLPDGAFVQRGNLLKISCGAVEVYIMDCGENKFRVEVLVNGQEAADIPKIGYADTLKLVFDTVTKTRDRLEQLVDASTEEPEGEDESVYSALTELAQDAGKPADIIRNSSLWDLKALAQPVKPIIAPGYSFLSELQQAFDAAPTSGSNTPATGSDTETHVSASLQGERILNGHPCRMCEGISNYDASRPYAPLKKKLVFIPGQGAVFVDPAQLPAKRKLNYDPERGVVLTESTVPTNSRKIRKFEGWR